jgi:sugar/nucleoside kinase (ribokinase family)
MKILLIGHSIIDNVEMGGEYKTSPGGIFYSLIGMLAVHKSNDEIYLATGYNRKSFHLFKKLYSRINLKYSQLIEELPEVFLEALDNEERKETYINLSTGLSLDNINDWNQFDGILINMITGFDITLEQLKRVRTEYSGPIYFDLHTLSRGVDKQMERKFRVLPDAEEWLKNIDLLQCNEIELKTLSVNMNETDVVENILSHGVHFVIVTRGKKGATIYSRNNLNLTSLSKPAKSVHAINKIGCGDIFGAVFFYNYLYRQDPETSLAQAIDFSGRAVSINISENIDLFLI